METAAPFPQDQTEPQLICCSTSEQNGFTNRRDSTEGNAVREQHPLDQSLGEHRCDSAFGINSGSTSSSGLTVANTSDNEPSALVPDIQTANVKNDAADGRKTACTHEDSWHRNPNGHLEMVGQDCKALTTIKKEARFELRAFQEEKKPSKLFDCSSEKEPIRVKKVRDSEEMEELERERQELIHSQAVKKNPGIATKWWNPPPVKTLEEELDPEKLESHRKYQERKQKRRESSNTPQESPARTDVSSVLEEADKKEDLSIEQMNSSTVLSQFQLEEKTIEIEGQQAEVMSEHCSGKRFSGGVEATRAEKCISSSLLENTNAGQVHSTEEKATEEKSLRADDPTDTEQTRAENVLKERSHTCENSGDLTSAQAVGTLLEDPELSSANVFCPSEEADSGLDDTSEQSQDTAPQELLSNGFSLDNVSDSGSSNEPTNTSSENSPTDHSLPVTPQATSPVDGEMGGRTTAQSEASASQSSPGTSLTEDLNMESLPNPETTCNPLLTLSPAGKKRDEVPAKSPLVSSETPQPLAVGGVQPPHAGERQEFSYFSKYSEAAELRSTASLTRPRERAVGSGPFRLRSHKQRTLSMIEDEIRAAQEREQELKRQRQTRGLRTAPGHKERTTSSPPSAALSAPTAAPTTVPTTAPTRLVVTAKTAPGTIHCVAFVPPAQDCPNSPTLSDVSSEGSDGGQRPKNYMQTLMEDYEVHKVKRREKMEDNRVLEAVRVPRHKSNMAVRWEAGEYSNQEEDEE